MWEESLWRNKFRMLSFSFENRKAILVFPSDENKTPKWLLKTEYFEAFQDFEFELVSRGYHLAYLENNSRWIGDDDLDVKLRFRDHLVQQYGLSPRCIPVGMSCGGLHALMLAARHPEMIRLLYLDAPVVNLLSCPFGLGAFQTLGDDVKQEALNARRWTMSDVISCRDYPIDHIPELVAAKIPMLLICGGSDRSVPFEENGFYLKKAYEETDVPFLFLFDAARGHHPHGPSAEDCDRCISFIDAHS